MRIISPFHDYYDGVQRMGQDPTLVYVRRESEGDPGQVPGAFLRSSMYVRDERHQAEILGVTIGFCGMLHPCFEVLTGEAEDWFFPDLDEAYKAVVASAESRAMRRELEDRIASDEESEYGFRHGGAISRRAVEEWTRAHAARDDEPFIRLGCPVFAVLQETRQGHRIVTRLIRNPRLLPFGFQRVMDPYSAYQELAMYLSGPLAERNDPPQDIDDETLARAKGFDRRSFRTDSPGKKLRRRGGP